MTAIEDENDFDAALVATNAHYETTLNWTPSGATRAAAIDTVVVPAPLQKIVTAHFAVDLLNGDWIYVGDATVNLSHTAGKMSLKVRKYADDDQNDSLTTTVSS